MRLLMVAGWVCAVALAVSASAPAAQTLATKNRTKLFNSQTSVLDTRARDQYRASVRLTPHAIQTPSKWGNGQRYDGRYRGKYLSMAKAAARRHGIPEDLFLRLVQQESNWQPHARSHKGAIGLAQLMPGTARLLRVNPHDPADNLEGGARYLSQQYRAFRSWPLALAAYNAGPEAVRKHNGIPPYRETRNYVRKIWGD